MATGMKRFTITVTSETEQCIDELKQQEFYNRPYAELYRCILDAGILAIKNNPKRKKAAKKKPAPTKTAKGKPN